MKTKYLAIILSLLATPSFACNCHVSGNSVGGFGGFAVWALPGQGCISSHISMHSSEIGFKETEPAIQKKPVKESTEKSKSVDKATGSAS